YIRVDRSGKSHLVTRSGRPVPARLRQLSGEEPFGAVPLVVQGHSAGLAPALLDDATVVVGPHGNLLLEQPGRDDIDLPLPDLDLHRLPRVGKPPVAGLAHSTQQLANIALMRSPDTGELTLMSLPVAVHFTETDHWLPGLAQDTLTSLATHFRRL